MSEPFDLSARRRPNAAILERIKGVRPLEISEEEALADPSNPNVSPTPQPELRETVAERIRDCGAVIQWAHCLRAADAILALPQLSGQPGQLEGSTPGMVLVPAEPTREMLNAAIDVDAFKLGDISPLGFRISPQMLFEQCYRAMIAAFQSHKGGA